MLGDDWERLADEVDAELKNPVHAGKTHYRKATYAAGCRGPLCRKAERDLGRLRTQRRAEDAGREYRPEPRTDDEVAVDSWLDDQIAWHEAVRRNATPPVQRCETCGTKIKEAV